MDYETILSAIGEEPEYLFKTSRGSAYGHYGDNSTVRNRSGAGHRDSTVGLQPRSSKTVYMSPADVDRMAGIFQNVDIGTQFTPSSYDKESKTGRAALSLIEDFGPKKAGSIMHEAPFTTVPQKGLIPVEINQSSSPVGSSGKGIHWGTPITEVITKGAIPARGGSGGMRAGQDTLQHSLNPLKLAKGGFVDKPLAGGFKHI